MKFEFYRQIFEKVLNMKFHQNPSNGSRVVPCGHTAMTKIIVAFRNFANAPEKQLFLILETGTKLLACSYFLTIVKL